MRVEDITIEVRSVALGRLGQIDVAEIDDLKIIKRFRNVGNWTMSLPADYQGATELAQAGRGLVVTGPGNRVLMSGPVSTFVKRETSDDSDGMWYFQGTDDMVHLADGLCFPTPGAAVTAQVNAYDIFASNAEDTLRHYVDVNRGPSAPVSRRISGLVLEPASLGRGGLVIGRARFDQMGPFLDRLASSGDVGFDVAQVGSQLQFQVYVPSDRSDTVRMDIDNDMLIETEYGFSAPSTTRPVIAGQGEMEARLFLQKTSAESLAAEAAWGRKIETFKDRRDTPDPDELEQEADTLLAEGGKTVTSLSVKPADENTMRYAVDWYLGDIVGVIVDGQELTSVVTEAIISIDADGIRISATIGDPTGFDFESKMIARNQDHEKRIQNMERNNGSIEWSTLPGVPSTFPPSAHTHDDRYYTETEINALIASVGATPSATPPLSPGPGKLWLDSDTGNLYAWYVDSTGGQWIEVGGRGVSGAIATRVTDLETRVGGSVRRSSAAKTFTGNAWTMLTAAGDWQVATPVSGGQAAFNGTWVIPENGVYAIELLIRLQSATNLIIGVKKNNNVADDQALILSQSVVGTSGYTAASVSGERTLAAGDVLRGAVFVIASAVWLAAGGSYLAEQGAFFGLRKVSDA